MCLAGVAAGTSKATLGMVASPLVHRNGPTGNLSSRARRHRTERRGIYYGEGEDGTRTYIATWKEAAPLNIADRPVDDLPTPQKGRIAIAAIW
jgi:hypothetical protein